MTIGGMHTRILVGVGAWLLGTAAATGGSLLAVSLLGQGIAGTGQQQLTSEAVNRALASEAGEPGGPSSAPASAALGSTTAASTHPGSTRLGGAPAASPSPQPTGGTLLTSAGGTVVAGCASAGAYLVSWSPQQGYEIASVVRGPAATATVRFWSSNSAVTMLVSCADGVPAATTEVRGSGDD